MAYHSQHKIKITQPDKKAKQKQKSENHNSQLLSQTNANMKIIS